MKPIEAIFRNGRLYDLTTNQSINLREDARIVLIVDSLNHLNPTDPYIAPTAVRTTDEVLKEVQQAGYYEFRKVFNREQTLYFTITAGHRDTGRSNRVTCQFEVTPLEELYVRRSDARQNEGKFHTTCHCVVSSCLTPDVLPKFEPVYVDSLNQAYTKTYETYFARFGSSAANIYDKLFMDQQQTQSVRALRYFAVGNQVGS